MEQIHRCVDHRNRFRALNRILNACTEDSDFVRNAENLSGQKAGAKYWTKPSELCARAFEAYIQDRICSVAQWLAHGTLLDDCECNGLHPYPVGKDRERISSVMLECLPLIFAE